MLIDWFHVDLACGYEFSSEREYLLFELQKLAQICLKLRALLEALDLRLASRASYEVKRDAQGAPFMAE